MFERSNKLWLELPHIYTFLYGSYTFKDVALSAMLSILKTSTRRPINPHYIVSHRRRNIHPSLLHFAKPKPVVVDQLYKQRKSSIETGKNATTACSHISKYEYRTLRRHPSSRSVYTDL